MTEPPKDIQPDSAPDTRIPLWRKLLYALIATSLVLLVIEGATSVVYAVIEMNKIEPTHEQVHCRYDADLGWSHIPSHVAPDLYGPGRTLTTNAQGLRATREYSDEPPAGKTRVLCLGDSFTMGYGVGDADSFPAKMEAFEPRIETINFGQGGYGLDQALLWYKRDGMRFKTDIVLFSYVYVDFFRLPIERFNNVFPKPVLEVENDKIVNIRNVPVPQKWGSLLTHRRLGALSQSLGMGRLLNDAIPNTQPAWHETIPEQHAIARAVFADLLRVCRERGQTLVIAYLPIYQMIAREPTRELECGRQFAFANNVPFINLVPTFSALHPRDLYRSFRKDWHFTIQGNELAARALLQALQQVVKDFPR